MKSFFAALVIAALLFGTAIYHLVKLEDISEKLNKINSEIYSSVNAENYDNAEEKVKLLKKEMISIDTFWSAMGNHEETDRIKENIAELEEYTKQKGKTDALAKSGALSLLLKHLPEGSRIKIQNIF